VRISADHLRGVCLAVLSSLGVDAAEADTVADNLVMAERRGIATHGVNFLVPLAERIAQGLVVVPTKVTTISDADAVVIAQPEPSKWTSVTTSPSTFRWTAIWSPRAGKGSWRSRRTPATGTRITPWPTSSAR